VGVVEGAIDVRRGSAEYAVSPDALLTAHPDPDFSFFDRSIGQSPEA
jgi:hypothetical protein